MSFSFFFKPKTIHVDCFTKSNLVYTFAPIVPAIKKIPQWWKRLPHYKEVDSYQHTSMKQCSGILDLYKVGIMLPLWSDLEITTFPNGELAYQFSDKASSCEFHDPSQRGEFASEQNYIHIKISSPWIFSSKEDVNWIVMDSFWDNINLLNYKTCTGVLNFKYQSATSINLFVQKSSKVEKFLIPHGRPMIHLVPIDNRQVKIHNHLIDSFEYQKRFINHYHSFQNAYSKGKKILNSRCPF